MPLNGSGVMTRLFNFAQDKINNVFILANRFDAELDGFATAVSTMIARDGQSTILNDIPFGNHRLKELGDATNDTDAMNRQTSDTRYIKVTGETRDAATTGNASIGGTLGVAGNVTFGGTLGVTGSITCAGSATFGATLGVTGAASFADAVTIGTDLSFTNSGSTIGRILWQGGGMGITAPFANHILFVTSGLAAWYVDNSRKMKPAVDNAYSLGDGAFRTSTIYSTTGTINTSDATEKALRDGTDIGGDCLVSAMTDAEVSAAKMLAREIGIFKWRDSVVAKGEGARLHAGITVQRIIEIMTAHGLDAFRYAFICRDEWDAMEALPGSDEVAGIPARPAGSRLSLRMDQLALFVARGQEARIAALEAAA